MLGQRARTRARHRQQSISNCHNERMRSTSITVQRRTTLHFTAFTERKLGALLGALSTLWPTMKISLPTKAGAVDASGSFESALRVVEQLRQTCRQHGILIDRTKAI